MTKGTCTILSLCYIARVVMLPQELLLSLFTIVKKIIFLGLELVSGRKSQSVGCCLPRSHHLIHIVASNASGGAVNFDLKIISSIGVSGELITRERAYDLQICIFCQMNLIVQINVRNTGILFSVIWCSCNHNHKALTTHRNTSLEIAKMRENHGGCLVRCVALVQFIYYL